MINTKSIFYISDPLYTTVKDSQVLNWLELLIKESYNVNLVLITPLMYVLKNRELRKIKLQEAKRILNNKVLEIYSFRGNDKTYLSSILIFLQLLFQFRGYYKSLIIIQTRTVRVILPLHILKKVLRNLKIVFDYRGAGAEELINSLGYASISEVNKRNIFIKYQKEIQLQKKMISIADHVICVSNNLKNYAIGLNNSVPVNKFTVIPGAADGNHFYFSCEIRNKIRKMLNITNNIVMVYSGKLSGFWHEKEAIFSLIKGLILKDDKIIFFCITPDTKEAMLLCQKYNIPLSNISIQYTKYRDIINILCAADFAIILRKNILTNIVSSPTKIAEYLLCGLPIIASKNIGDYSDYIEINNFGLILSEDQNINTEKILEKVAHYKYDRENISALSRKYFSKQSFLDKVKTIYNSFP